MPPVQGRLKPVTPRARAAKEDDEPYDPWISRVSWILRCAVSTREMSLVEWGERRKNESRESRSQ